MTATKDKTVSQSATADAAVTPVTDAVSLPAPPAPGESTVDGVPYDAVATVAATDDGKVEVTLAHHLDMDGTDRVAAMTGLVATNSKQPGEKIRVSRADASAIIEAGYAHVDPTNRDAVNAILNG